jgi:hypothetical protein
LHFSQKLNYFFGDAFAVVEKKISQPTTGEDRLLGRIQS